jgi:hypothetical protein
MFEKKIKDGDLIRRWLKSEDLRKVQAPRSWL